MCPLDRLRLVLSNYCSGQCNTEADKEMLMCLWKAGDEHACDQTLF